MFTLLVSTDFSIKIPIELVCVSYCSLRSYKGTCELAKTATGWAFPLVPLYTIIRTRPNPLALRASVPLCTRTIVYIANQAR
jgi:hypothetical protein